MAAEFEKQHGSLRFLLDFTLRNLAILLFHTLWCLILGTFIDSAHTAVIEGFFCYTLFHLSTKKLHPEHRREESQ